VTVTIAAGETATLSRTAGGSILMNGASCTGSPTVSNTDTITVTGSSGQDTLALDLTNGPFAPGAASEATGDPEIELEANLGSNSTFAPDTIAITGSGGADTYRLGSAGVNLNDDDDADLTAQAAGPLASAGGEVIKVAGAAGQDTLSGAGALASTTAPVPYSLRLDLDGGTEGDVLTGGAGDDTLSGGPGADTEAGGDGTDTFREGSAANGGDSISGGYSPFDKVDYSARASTVRVDLNGLADDGATGELDNVQGDVESFLFGSGNDFFNDGMNLYVTRRLYGGLGMDALHGGIGTDLLYGCGPDDVSLPQYAPAICAGDGNDALYGRDGGDTLVGGAGDDDEFGDAGSDTFVQGPAKDGADDLRGGSERDTVTYFARFFTSPLAVSLDNVANDGEDIDQNGVGEEQDNIQADVENVNGSHGPNRLTGSGVANTFSGGAMNDMIRLEGGDDRANGNSGADKIFGGPGRDTLYGDDGNDEVSGEDDDDTVDGGGHNDTLSGGMGRDNVVGWSGNDTILEDVTANGADTIRGNTDVDTVKYSQRTTSVVVDLDGASDDGEDSNGDGLADEGDNVGSDVENLWGGAGGDRLAGQAGIVVANSLFGLGGADTLTGDDGDDLVDGGFGADKVDGGNGTDTTSYAGRTVAVRADPGGAVDGTDADGDGIAEEGDSIAANVENLEGGSAADKLFGSGAANLLKGNLGNDVLDGGLGPDELDGGLGIDTALYGSRTTPLEVTLDSVANDGAKGEADNALVENIVGGSASDILIGNGVSNTLEGGGGWDRLEGGPGVVPDRLEGGLGSDTADYRPRADALVVTLDGVGNDGAAGEGDNALVENVDGGSGPDRIFGSTVPNWLQGGDGADLLDGGFGADGLVGGTGSDTVSYGSRRGRVAVRLDGIANDGNDSDGDGVGEEADNALGIENIVGGTGNDLLVGDAARNVLDGRLGSDVLNGADGIDAASYVGRTTALDVSLDKVANDGASGESDNALVEDVYAGSGADTLSGDTGPNLLDGGPGNDVLDGDLGADRLIGGLGTDLADYRTRTGRLAVRLDGLPNDGADANGDGIAEEGDSAEVENVLGGIGSDLVVGSSGANALVGGGGSDKLDGGLGRDMLDGGPGIDTTTFASRTARVVVRLDGLANDGSDRDGDDIGEEGDNVLTENATGGSGVDLLLGDAYGNTFDGGLGADTIEGSGGTDEATYEVRAGRVAVSLDNAANDGDDPDADLFGEEGDNVHSDIEIVTGGKGDDWLSGSTGQNVLDGGPGSDWAGYRGRTATVKVTLDGIANDGTYSSSTATSLERDNVLTENVEGGSAFDVLWGNGGVNWLSGGPGNDILVAYAGNDHLTGGGGADDELGGDGDDTFHQQAAPTGADDLVGGNGVDLADYSLRTTDLTITLNGAGGDGASGENDNVRSDVERVDGGTGNDVIEGSGNVPNDLFGGGGNDKIKGWEGNDVLRGAGGADELWGGTQNDQLLGSYGADVLHGDENDDKVDGGPDNDFVDGNWGLDYVYGGDGNDELHGGPNEVAGCGCSGGDDDRLFGGAGNDKLYGGAYADELTGGPGDDYENGEQKTDDYHADADPGADTYEDGGDSPGIPSSDQIEYTGRTAPLVIKVDDNLANDGEDGEHDNVKPGIEVIFGGSGNDLIAATEGNDKLWGNNGSDSLIGWGGDDRLDGGAGEDSVYGGAGADYFLAKDGAKDTLDGGADSDTVGTFDAGLDVLVNFP
jgi:Ca2+-binding RTX toxin-like protein